MQMVANLPEISQYVADRIGCRTGFGGHKSIGVLDDAGQIVAGVLYVDWNGRNIFMHVAAEPGKVWLTRASLYEFFAYPFLQCGCDRVTGWVEESNTAARRLDEHLGFTEEARLSGAAADGGDIILYVMKKRDCRFIGERYGQEERAVA